MNMVCPDLCTEDSRVCTQFCAVREKSRVKNTKNLFLGSYCGFVIPVQSRLGQGMRMHFERLVSWYGRKQLIPIYIEDNILNFYLKTEVKSTETKFCEKILSSQETSMAEQFVRKCDENSEHRSGST